MSEVKIVKLVSGEELLCTMSDDNTANKPCLITREAEGKINFEPYVSFIKGGLVLGKTSVSWTATPEDNLAEKYLEIASNL
jgi:hypothetical protein